MPNSEWEKHIRMEREQKDIFFSIHPQSPIPPEEREGFQGLKYYTPQEKYRFELELHKHPVKKKVRMTYTRGEEREFIRWGEFRFKIQGEEQVLQAYKNSAEENQLFIPFRDPTNSEETYGAGRYLDLHANRDRTKDRKWILDLTKPITRGVLTTKITPVPSYHQRTGLRHQYTPEKKQDKKE